MKYLFTIIATLFVATLSFAQTDNPVTWDWKATKTGQNEYQLTFTAIIDDGWYVYSQYLDPDGPIPTSFEYTNQENFELIGKNIEAADKTSEGYDELFAMNLVKFANTVTFTQSIKTNNDTKIIEGFLTYMTCDEQRCLPPREVDFEITLP